MAAPSHQHTAQYVGGVVRRTARMKKRSGEWDRSSGPIRGHGLGDWRERWGSWFDRDRRGTSCEPFLNPSEAAIVSRFMIAV
jgi:hypothetical protein